MLGCIEGLWRSCSEPGELTYNPLTPGKTLGISISSLEKFRVTTGVAIARSRPGMAG